MRSGLFERGEVGRAAEVVAAELRRVTRNHDLHGVQACEKRIEQMRAALKDESLRQFDDSLQSEQASVGASDRPQDEVPNLSPVGLALACCGAALMLVAVFLPRVEAKTFATVAQNTLIQSGDGWFFIGLAVGIAGTTYRAYAKHTRSRAPMVLGALAVAVAIYEGVSKSSLRLCPTTPTLFNASCEIARPSIGIYAAGVGGVLAFLGGWQLWEAKAGSRILPAATPTTEVPVKTCPRLRRDCAPRRACV